MTVSKNLLEQRLNSSSEKINEAQKVQDHFDYGTITDIDWDTYQVQVNLYGQNVDILGNSFWPLITQREVIFLLWGQLRPGMWVRVHWRGPFGRATWALAEVVGDENANFLQQQQMSNDGSENTDPHKIFAGGLPV